MTIPGVTTTETNKLIMHISYTWRTIVIMTLMLAMTLGSRSEMTESVIFHLIDNIHTSISSWIVTTALDFEPYSMMLYNVNEYA